MNEIFKYDFLNMITIELQVIAILFLLKLNLVYFYIINLNLCIYGEN